MSHNRILNFSAGPAALPLPVLEQAQRELVSLPGIGMSVMEISHRSEAFKSVLNNAIDDIRKLANIPSSYKILMLQGGASLQFLMVPMNLLDGGSTTDYIDTGTWAKKAIKEAERVGEVNIAGTGKTEGYSLIPTQSELTLTPGAAYVHITSNNTVEGTQWSALPDVGDTPLVSDSSSDIFSKPIDIGRYDLIYAGAQKNLGPAGVTLVIINEDLLERCCDNLPTMLDYRTHASNDSLYNTPNTFGVYMLGLMVKWLRSLGGLSTIGKVNARKAAKLYKEIDRSGFYRPRASKKSRSLMNITFRLETEELEAMFVNEANAAGLKGLKGHRSVGGIRASIYNAFPEEGIDTLIEFMRGFEQRMG